ncbi:MAG: DUF1573 domain-containing protein [Saprospiraceae bacterium]
MKRIFVTFALFASIAAVVVAQSTVTPKKTKATTTKKVDKAVSKKTVVATAKSDKVVAPVATAAAAAKGPVATFETVEMDYGKIKKGSEPLRVFNFKNTGTEPLIISNAQGSCGCTVPTYPKEPIMPGQSSKIEVRYDTQRVGGFTKSVTLTTNEAVVNRVLTIKGEVEAAPADAPVDATQTPH